MPSLCSFASDENIFHSLKGYSRIFANLYLLLLTLVQFQTVISKPTTQPRVNLKNIAPNDISLQHNLSINEENAINLTQRVVEIWINNRGYISESTKEYKEINVRKKHPTSSRKRQIRSITNPLYMLSNNKHSPNIVNKDGNMLSTTKNQFNSEKETKNTKLNTEQNSEDMHINDDRLHDVTPVVYTNRIGIDRFEVNSTVNTPKYNVDYTTENNLKSLYENNQKQPDEKLSLKHYSNLSRNSEQNSNYTKKPNLYNLLGKNERILNINDNTKLLTAIDDNTTYNNISPHKTENNTPLQEHNTIKSSNGFTYNRPELSHFLADKDKIPSSNITGTSNNTNDNENEYMDKKDSTAVRYKPNTTTEQIGGRNEQASTIHNKNESIMNRNINDKTLSANSRRNETNGYEVSKEDKTRMKYKIDHEKIAPKLGTNNNSFPIFNASNSKTEEDMNNGTIAKKSTTDIKNYSRSYENNSIFESRNKDETIKKDLSSNKSIDYSVSKNTSDKNQYSQGSEMIMNKNADDGGGPLNNSNFSDSTDPLINSIASDSNEANAYHIATTNGTLLNVAPSVSASVQSFKPRETGKPKSVEVFHTNFDSSTSKLVPISEISGNLPSNLTAKSSIQAKLTPNKKFNNSTGGTKHNETKDNLSSDPIKYSAIQRDFTSNITSTSTIASATSNSILSDTIAFNKSDLSLQSVMGPPESSENLHDDAGDNKLINDTDDTPSKRISINEKKLPIKSKTSSSIDISSEKMDPASVTEEVTNKTSNSSVNLDKSKTKMEQPNTTQSQPSAGKEKTAPIKTRLQNNSRQASLDTSTKPYKENDNNVDASHSIGRRPVSSSGDPVINSTASDSNEANAYHIATTNGTLLNMAPSVSASVQSFKPRETGKPKSVEVFHTNFNSSTSKLVPISEISGNLPSNLTANSSIQAKLTPNKKFDNSTGGTKHNETRDNLSSDPIKYSAIQRNFTSNITSTSTIASATSNSILSDTIAFNKSDLSLQSVMGPPESSANLHDIAGDNKLINDTDDNLSKRISMNEKKLPIKSKTSSSIDISSKKMDPALVTEEVTNKISNYFVNLDKSKTKIEQPNTTQSQPSAGKEKTAPIKTRLQNNSRQASLDTSTKPYKDNDASHSIGRRPVSSSGGETRTNAEIIGSESEHTNILFLNQTKGIPISDNQFNNRSDPLKNKISPEKKMGEDDILDFPYTNDVSEEKNDSTNEINSEDKIESNTDFMVVMTEATMSDSKREHTTKVEVTPNQTVRTSIVETSEHATGKLNNITKLKIDDKNITPTSKLPLVRTTLNPKNDAEKNKPSLFNPELPPNHISSVKPFKTTANLEQSSSETKENLLDRQENKECANEKSSSGALGSALYYGALAGSAGALGALLSQILKMLKDLLSKDDGKNNEDNENNTGNTDNQIQENTNEVTPNQQQNTQSDNMQDFLEQEFTEAEDEIMNKINDKIDGIEGSVMDTIEGKLTEVEDCVIADLKEQILHGDGSMLQNAKAAFIGDGNNLFQNVKGRLMEAKDDLIADIKTPFKSVKETDDSKLIPKDSVDLRNGGGKNPRTNIQMLFLNDKASTRRISWPTTRNDYLGKTRSTANLDKKQQTKIS